MADGKVIIDTQLNASGAEQGISKLKKSLTGIGSVAKTGLGAATKVIGAASTAVTAFGGYAVKAGMSFEAGMSKVQAISGANAKEMELLTAKAKEMGAKTKFSAAEASSAFEFMSMAGWKAGDMLNGIEPIMNLAAASGEDLATTSDIVTDALTAFGLTAKDSGRFADVLAQASSNANTNVGLMGETFKYVAPVAGALGYSAEDTAVAISLMANNGIKASSAGTALRSIFTNLAKPTKSVSVAMEQLGISLTDSSGKMKPLSQLMVEMRGSFAGLTEEQKAQYAASLAGKTGMSGLLAIVNASDKDFNKLTKSINNSNGAAQKMADTMQNNLSGQITILKSAIEGLAIEIYDSFKDEATKFVKAGTDIISNIVKGLQNGDKKAVSIGVNALMELIVSTIVKATPTVVNTAIDLIAAFAGGIMSNLGLIATAAVTIASNLAQKLSENIGVIASGFTSMIVGAINFVSANLPDMLSFAVSLIGKIGSALLENAPMLMTAVQNLISTAFSAIGDAVPILKPVTNILKTLADNIDKVTAVIAPLIAAWAAYKTAMVATQAITKAVTVVQAALNVVLLANPIGLVIAAIAALVAAFVVLWNKSDAFRNFWINLWNKVVDVVKPVWKNIQSFASDAWSAIQKTWDKSKDFFSKLFDGIKTVATTVFNGIKTVATNIFNAVKTVWNALSPAFTTIFNAIKTVVTTAFNVIKTTATTIFNAVKTLWNGLSPVFSSVFELVKKVVTTAFNTIKSISTTVFDFIKKAWASLQPLFSSIFGAIKEIVSTAFTAIKPIVTTVISAVKSTIKTVSPVVTTVFGAIKTIVTKVFNAIKTIATTVFGAIKSLVKPVGTVISGTFKSAFAVIKGVWNAVVSYFTGIFNGIKGIFTAIKSLWKGDFQGAWNAIKGVFSNAATTFTNIGKNLIQGLINGVKGMVGTAVKTVQDVGSSLLSGIKGALGIHSPSTKMKKIGVFTMQGMIDGMQSLSKTVVSSAVKTMGEMIEATQKKAEAAADRVSKLRDNLKDIIDAQAKAADEIKKKTEEITKLEKKAAKQTGKAKEETLAKIKKIEKEREKLENNVTKLVEKEGKTRTKIKKAEFKQQEADQKAYLDDTAKDILDWYDEVNSQPSLTEKLKKDVKDLSDQIKDVNEKMKNTMEELRTKQQEELEKAKEDYEASLEERNKIYEEKTAELKEEYDKKMSDLDTVYQEKLQNIKNTQEKELNAIAERYKEHYDEVKKVFDDKLSALKDTYEKNMQEIATSQKKLYESTLNFTGLFDDVKEEEIVDGDKIIANAAAQTAKVNKFYEDLQKLQAMNLPEGIIEQFKDMGVGAADQLEVFVNMSKEQVDEFVRLWTERNETAKKLSEEFYKNQIDEITKGYEEEKTLLEKQREDALKKTTEQYDKEYKAAEEYWTKRSNQERQKTLKWYADQQKMINDGFNAQQKLLTYQHKTDIARIATEYQQKTDQINKSYNDMFATELDNYTKSMNTLKEATDRKAEEIGRALKQGLIDGSSMSQSEARGIAQGITDKILAEVRSSLQIHSPSRVFANIGDMCIRGFEQPFENYNPVDLMKPSVNNVMNAAKRGSIQTQQKVTTNTTTNSPVLNFYDSAVSPDAVYRQFNKTMRYGLAGGLA